MPLEDFASRVWGRPGFEPWNLRLVHDAEGALVGATQVYLSGDAGYVARIAVRRDRRGLGLARAMLVDAFALARAHGAGPLLSVHGLAYRRARALRAGRHGRELDLDQPGDQPLIGAPEIARAITSRWISEVPSKIV